MLDCHATKTLHGSVPHTSNQIKSSALDKPNRSQPRFMLLLLLSFTHFTSTQRLQCYASGSPVKRHKWPPHTQANPPCSVCFRK